MWMSLSSYLLLSFLLCLLLWCPIQAQQMSFVDHSHPLAQGLAGWWRGVTGQTGSFKLFDLASGNIGILTNMDPFFGATSGWQPTNRQGGFMHLNFDGVDDVVGLGNPAIVTDMPRKTLCLWMNPIDAGAGTAARLLDKGDNTGWIWRLNGVGMTFTQDFGGITSSWDGGAISFGVWQHVCVTFDSTNVSNDLSMFV